MRHGPLILLLLILTSTLSVAAERGVLRTGDVPTRGTGSEAVATGRIVPPGQLDRRDDGRLPLSRAKTRRVELQDMDLRGGDAPLPVRALTKDAALTPALFGDLALRPSGDNRALVPRDASRDAPWSADRLLADATHMNDAAVSLAISPTTGDLYAVFEATDLGGTDRDIHIARSRDAGQTWDVWEMPAFSYDEYTPDIAIDGAGFLHVVWIRDDGYIVRARSADADDPTSWAWVKGLYTDSTNATPCVAVDGAGDFSTVFIAASYQEVNWDLYQWEWTLVWMWSTDSGETIGYDALVPDGYPDLWPDAALDGALAHLINGEASVYGDATRILVASDAVNGGFADITDLSSGWTSNSCGFPRIAAGEDEVFAVFQHDWNDGLGNIDGDVIYCFSWDAGATIYGPYEIIADEYESVGPAVYARDGIVGCLWLDAPAGDDEFDIAARQAGGHGHPDNWGDIEIVTDEHYAEPQYRYLDGAVGDGVLHAAWIDRRDTPTQGHNVYTCERATEADLSPYAPTGWDAPLVGSMYAGERESGWLAADRPAYLSFAFMNDGLADVSADLRIELHVDGALHDAWVLSGGLPVSTYVAVEDHEIELDAGDHDVAFILDVLDAVDESDETDNTLAETWTWLSGNPALRIEPDVVTCTVEAPSKATLDRLGDDPPLRRLTHLDPLGASLRAALDRGAATSLRCIVEPALRLDVAALSAALDGAPRSVRRETVARALKSALAEADRELAPAFASLGADKSLAAPRPLWLAGAYATVLTPDGVAALAEDPAVGRIWLDDTRSQLYGDAAPLDPAARATALAWHLSRIGADAAWSAGLDGDGVLVGHVDSGVCYDHPDLDHALWDGGASYPNHGWDSVDDDDDPYDGDTSIYHGSHTAGLIVGDGTSGTTTGAAPGAELMILRAIPGYFDDLVEALQFGLDNGPVDFFSMSAGWDDPADDLKAANRANAEALLAMGVPWIVAAGNGDGYGGHYDLPQDIGSPADCPDPWYGDGGHSAVIAVGATTSADAIWSYSSLGPTRWDIEDEDYDDYPYPPGLVKPDVSAPGASITSTLANSGYATYSGTSMACPLVAGAAAILYQVSPGTTPETLAEALESSALDIEDVGRDNAAGAGLLDIPAALDSIPTLCSESFVLHNDGPLPLDLTELSWAADWLELSPLSGRVAPADSLILRASFDPAGLAGGLYSATIVITSNDPDAPHTARARLVIGTTTDAQSTPAALPARLAGHPNPFNPRTTLSFELETAGRVELSVYDLQGRHVRRLVGGILAAGRHEIAWDGRDDAGRALASGTYLARARWPGGASASRKLALVR